MLYFTGTAELFEKGFMNKYLFIIQKLRTVPVGVLLMLTVNTCSTLFQADQSFGHKLWVDITEADSIDLQCIELVDSLNKRLYTLEHQFNYNRDFFDYRKHLKVIFRYRDRSLLPVFKTISNDRSLPLIHRIRAIAITGQIGDSDCVTMLRSFCRDTNDVIREYAANSLGKSGSKSDLPFLMKLLKNERNGYVRFTIKAAISRIDQTAPPPHYRTFILDTNGMNKVPYLFNPGINGNTVTAERQVIESVIVQNRMTGELVFPHQQFKMNPKTVYNRHSYGVNFGTDQSPMFHVGEDSAPYMEGLPIHSVSDGVVSHIVYEQSWGFLVAIESYLKVHGTITFFYGHLSHCIDVRIGQKVAAGEKIGELGPQESFENGGYMAHLHMGAAKGSYEYAMIAGYAGNVDRWYNPVALIGKENSGGRLRYGKLFKIRK